MNLAQQTARGVMWTGSSMISTTVLNFVILAVLVGVQVGYKHKKFFSIELLKKNFGFTSDTPAPIAQAQFQITPQISYGWKVDNQGRLVANLQPGEEATRPFHLNEGFSTPWIVLPPYHYSLGFTNQQTIIVDEGFKQTVVHPNDHYSMGTIVGEKKLRFTALKGGADIIVDIKKLKK